jgi:GNAT superfamily N-acetyltransferase
VAAAITIRELGSDERAWADERYRAIGFAETPPGALVLVAERAGLRVGLGRLVEHAPGVVELGGIWTDEAARGAGVARAMVTALLGRVEAASALAAVAAGPQGPAPLWCIPFRHLRAFYQSFGFADAARPWPAPIARKVAALIAQEQPIAVLALHRRH